MVELGNALVLAAEGRVGTLGGLLLDDNFHLLTELALLGTNGVFDHTAIGDTRHSEYEERRMEGKRTGETGNRRRNGGEGGKIEEGGVTPYSAKCTA